ncbi:MAG: AAA family ATPase [Acidobacteriota bacterium]|nr:AAA family ATPase [Acidobacteriota bacterium]
MDIEFEAGRPIVMIYGENGNGKSTIVDAIDFVCNEEYGSLKDRHAAKARAYVPAVGAKDNEVLVSLTYGGKTWTTRLGSQKPVSDGPGNRPEAIILRRQQILDVVTETPKTRYQTLQRFITVAKIEEAEHKLREATRALKSKYEEATRANVQADDQLRKLWADEGSPEGDHIRWAEEKTKDDPAALQAAVNIAEGILKALEAALNARHQLRMTEEEYSRRVELRDAAEKAFVGAQASDRADTDALIDLLHETQRYLAKHGPVEACPVCVREIKPHELERRISDSLASMREMVKLKKTKQEAARKADEFVAVLSSALNSLNLNVRALKPLLEGCALAEVAALGINWEEFPSLGGDEDVDFSDEAERLLAKVEPCRETLKKRKDDAQKVLNQLKAIKNLLEAVKRTKAEARGYERVYNRLVTFYEIVEARRKAYVEDVLQNISGTVEELYMKIHPNEPVGDFRFYLKRNVMGSLEFDSRFETASKVPPQAYYSESHLDTLGICIFLAMAKLRNPTNSIIVLDDVVTSVDRNHLARFISMLHDVADDFSQLILTTHYFPWREEYRRGNNPKLQLIELRGWTRTGGIQRLKTRPFIEELRALVADPAFDRQILASRAGIFLEYLLDFITYQYECPVPRQPNPNLTLGQLDAAISSKLGKLLFVKKVGAGGAPDQELELYPMIKDATQWMWVRNQVGAHFNRCGDDVPDGQIKEFGEATLKLADTLLCGGCGTLPNKNKSGSYWECHCGKLHMRPLTPPGRMTQAAASGMVAEE